MSTTNANLIGRRVRAARERLGLNQNELARKAGVSPAYVNRLEIGRFARPSVEHLTSIATVLGLKLADLTETADPLSADVLENLAKLTGQDRQLLNEAVSVILTFAPDQRQDAIAWTLESLRTLARMKSAP